MSPSSATICSIWAAVMLVRVVACRRVISCLARSASVSAIQAATVAGLAPASRAARYWPSLRSQSSISRTACSRRSALPVAGPQAHRAHATALSKSREPTSAMAVNESGLGSSADGESEEGIDRSFERAGTPLHLGE